MNTLKSDLKEATHLIIEVVPNINYSNIGYLDKILILQVENHYITKGKKDMSNTEMFLFVPEELKVLIKEKRIVISLPPLDKKLEFTQEIVGFGAKISSNHLIKNRIFNKIKEKIQKDNHDKNDLSEFFISSVFIKEEHYNSEDFLKIFLKLNEQSDNTPSLTNKNYLPIHSMNKRFEELVQRLGLFFEGGPEQSIETENGVIYLPYK